MVYRMALGLCFCLQSGFALALTHLPLENEVQSFVGASSQPEVEASVQALVNKIVSLNREGWADNEVFRGLYAKTQDALNRQPIDASLLHLKFTALHTQLQTRIANENRKRLTARVVAVLASASVGFLAGSLVLPVGWIAGPIIAYWTYALGAPDYIRGEIDPDLALFFIEDLKRAVPENYPL